MDVEDGPPRGGRLRDEQKTRTRAALLDSAGELFARHGYGAVRVDDIAAAVGCSRATFYLHFAGKSDVLRAVAARTTVPSVRSLCEDLDVVLTSGSRADFVKWATRVIEWFQRHRQLLPAWNEAVAVDPGFREIARAALDALPDAVPDFLDRWPEDRRPEARLRVELLVAQLERFFTARSDGSGSELSAARTAQVLTDIWYPALRAPGENG
ncbi:TetR/AcrR family transcriptional regulator [Nocardia takedensis]